MGWIGYDNTAGASWSDGLRYGESDAQLRERRAVVEEAKSRDYLQSEIAKGGKAGAMAAGQLAQMENEKAGMEQYLAGLVDQAKEEEDAKREQQRSLLSQVEDAFSAMLSSCVNAGQVAALKRIQQSWINDMSTNVVTDYDTYMMKWRAGTGAVGN